MVEKIFRVRSLTTFRDGTLSDYLKLPWPANEDRDIPESIYNKCIQSAGPESFEVIGQVIPPSTRKKNDEEESD